ncbi:MAG: methylated-DNA--[protein]-cysteine S-methyltransferase [Clostridium sp.]|nr:methylated-DNA--[protein]-cysteine S-methyltransferase [Clostridium sp.]
MKQISEYLEGNRKEFDFPIYLEGTEFQKKVWDTLRKIPYGETRSYKDIAIMVGNEKASRAVGGANNKNPIIIAVPCHRVIGKNGKLVGFGCGIDVKEKLLDIEMIKRK